MEKQKGWEKGRTEKGGKQRTGNKKEKKITGGKKETGEKGVGRGAGEGERRVEDITVGWGGGQKKDVYNEGESGCRVCGRKCRKKKEGFQGRWEGELLHKKKKPGWKFQGTKLNGAKKLRKRVGGV